MKSFLSSRDAIGGAALILLGGFALFEALTYRLGSLTRMGPAFFPVVLSTLLILLGAMLLASWYLGNMDQPARVDLRPLLAISLSIIVFAITIRNLGLAPAISLTTLTAACAETFRKPWAIIMLAIFLSVFCWLVFIVMLGLPFDVWRLPS